MQLKILFILLYVCIIFLYFLLYNITFLFYSSKQYNTIYGSIRCVDKGLYKTCLYKNIYYYKNEWVMYLENNSTNTCVNIFSHNLSYCWKPSIYSLNDLNSLSINISRIYYDLSVPFGLTYIKNYGHALWDDLYSIYTSIVKLGYANSPFNLVMTTNNTNKNPFFIKDIYFTFEMFSKRRIIFLDIFKNTTLLFKKLVVGSSHQCQRCITLDYSLKYSREYNITKKIRDRMYEVFNIKPSYSHPIEGIIVHNKRYNKHEIDVLKKVISHYKNSTYVKLYYIDFKIITSFYKQLKLLSRIHIYISGPGTGLLNFPFIADPGVVINLGHIHFGCPQYLEQYMLEGSPHYKAFYYSPQKRMIKLNYSYIINMIDGSINFLMNNKIIYVRKEDNLNEIGKLFIKICKDNKIICEKLINKYDWGYGICRGIWAENIVYFPSLYNKIPELKKIVELYNNTNHLGCIVGSNYSKQKQCK